MADHQTSLSDVRLQLESIQQSVDDLASTLRRDQNARNSHLVSPERMEMIDRLLLSLGCETGSSCFKTAMDDGLHSVINEINGACMEEGVFKEHAIHFRRPPGSDISFSANRRINIDSTYSIRFEEADYDRNVVPVPQEYPLEDSQNVFSNGSNYDSLLRSGITVQPLSGSLLYLAKVSHFGTIRVGARKVRQRTKISHKFHQYRSFFFELQPKFIGLQDQCLSFQASICTSHFGLFLSTTVRPIIGDCAPVWKIIENGDERAFYRLLADGEITPNDMRSDGVSILQAAVYWRRSGKIIRWLLLEGADPFWINDHGYDCMKILLTCCWSKVPGFSHRASFKKEDTWATLEALRLKGITLDDYDGSEIQKLGTTNDRISELIDVEDLSQLPDFGHGLNHNGLGQLSNWEEFASDARHKSYAVVEYIITGMDPNDPRWCPEFSTKLPPLYILLCSLKDAQQEEGRNHVISNIAFLIKLGANKFHTGRLRFESNIEGDTSDNMITPTLMADKLDVRVGWELALRMAGYDPIEVDAKDLYCRQQYLHNNDVFSTALERPGIQSNGYESLRLRKVSSRN